MRSRPTSAEEFPGVHFETVAKASQGGEGDVDLPGLHSLVDARSHLALVGSFLLAPLSARAVPLDRRRQTLQ